MPAAEETIGEIPGTEITGEGMKAADTGMKGRGEEGMRMRVEEEAGAGRTGAEEGTAGREGPEEADHENRIVNCFLTGVNTGHTNFN